MIILLDSLNNFIVLAITILIANLFNTLGISVWPRIILIFVFKRYFLQLLIFIINYLIILQQNTIVIKIIIWVIYFKWLFTLLNIYNFLIFLFQFRTLLSLKLMLIWVLFLRFKQNLLNLLSSCFVNLIYFFFDHENIFIGFISLSLLHFAGSLILDLKNYLLVFFRQFLIDVHYTLLGILFIIFIFKNFRFHVFIWVFPLWHIYLYLFNCFFG
jgi:hypothetical protein